jgi:hypothetical protein
MIKSILAAGVAASTLVAPAMAKVTYASQLKDVQPTEWSYQAISNLISRYGCVAGFPDGTFKAGQAATRAELAALVNACIDRISEYQSAEDARLAASLKEQAAKWNGTQAAVAKLQLAAAQKAQGVGNYVGVGVNLNQQGVAGNGYSAQKTVAGLNLNARYSVKTFSNNNAVSLRPYLNAAAGPNGNIGSAGGALVSYDWSIAKAASGVSKANIYAGAGYQIPFVNNSQANSQSAIGSVGQAVLALGTEARLTNSLIGYSQLTFPTTNAGKSYGNTNGTYSPVFSTGLGVKF